MDYLKKGCGCITHDGPHWAHMNRRDKEATQEWFQKLLDENCDLALGVQGLTRKENMRLASLRSALRANDLDRLPEPLRAPNYKFFMSGQQMMHRSIQTMIFLGLFTPYHIESENRYVLIEA